MTAWTKKEHEEEESDWSCTRARRSCSDVEQCLVISDI